MFCNNIAPRLVARFRRVAPAACLALACAPRGNQAPLQPPATPAASHSLASGAKKNTGPATNDQSASARAIAYALADVPGLVTAHVTPLADLDVGECGSPTGASVAFAIAADDKVSCVQNAGQWRCAAGFNPDAASAARAACTAEGDAIIAPPEFAVAFRELVPIGSFAVRGGPIDISQAHQSHLVFFAGDEFYLLAPSEGRWLVSEAPFRLNDHGPSLLTGFIDLGDVGGTSTVAVTRNHYEFPLRLNVGVWTMTVMQPAGKQWMTIATIPIGIRIEDTKLLLKVFLRPHAKDGELHLAVEEAFLPVSAKAKLVTHQLWQRALEIQGHSGAWELNGDRLEQRR